METVTSVAVAALAAIAPVALFYLRQWVAAHVKDQQLQQWANGALSFAGQAYANIAKAREANPTVPLGSLIDQEARRAADAMMDRYDQTATSLNASIGDAESRVRGELGKLLAVDPTVSVAKPDPAKP